VSGEGILCTAHQLAFLLLVVESGLQGRLFSDDQTAVAKQRTHRDLLILTKEVKKWQEGEDATHFLLATEAEAIEHLKRTAGIDTELPATPATPAEVV